MTSPIGVQLYSLREEIKDDMAGVFEQLAETGYIGAEPFGGIDHNKAAPVLKDLGFEVYSMHADLPLGDTQAKVLEQAEAYGVTQIICPWRPPETFTTVDGIKQLADTLNEAAQVAKSNGYQYAYHNHDFEFISVDGRIAYDIFVEHLDPSVYLQLDTYWVQVGGQQITHVINKLGERAPLLHIKDGPATREADMQALGQGVIDIPAIIEAAGDNAKWLIVELDRCATDMMTAIKESFTYMTSEGLAHGR